MENGLAVLKDNMLVNVGEAYIVVNLLPEGAEEQGRSYDTLKLKMFGGPNNGEIYEFNTNEMKNESLRPCGRLVCHLRVRVGAHAGPGEQKRRQQTTQFHP